jgi:hypothetical protein
VLPVIASVAYGRELKYFAGNLYNRYVPSITMVIPVQQENVRGWFTGLLDVVKDFFFIYYSYGDPPMLS